MPFHEYDYCTQVFIKFKLASTDEDRTIETCIGVPMLSVLKEYSTDSMNHLVLIAC